MQWMLCVLASKLCASTLACSDDAFEFAANMPHLDEFDDSDDEPDWENQPFAD